MTNKSSNKKLESQKWQNVILWTSSPESVENNEPTVLAIVETVLAVAIYWAVAWYWDTHIHLL